MSVPARGKLLRLFSTAIVDQVMLSGSNLLVGFLLIRFTTDSVYGAYVLVQSAILLVASAQGAWLAQPLAAVAPRKPPDERRLLISTITHDVGRALTRLAPALLILPLAGFLLGLCGAQMAIVLACAIVAGWGAMRRDYLRSVLLIYAKPHALLGADAIYVAVLLAGIGLAVFGSTNAIIWTTASLGAAAWAGKTVAHRAIAHDPGWVTGDSAAAWRQLQGLALWSLSGAVIYWLFGQSYSYVLATRLDLKAVTDVNASRLLLMPSFVLTLGVQGLLTPMVARWNAEQGFNRMMRRLLGILMLIACVHVLYFAFVWLLRDWLTGDLLHKQIGDRDRLLLLWAGVAIVGLMRDMLQCSLAALGKFKSMARQIALSAVVALTLMWFGTAWWGAAAVLIGQIAGEAVNLAGIVLLLRRQSIAPLTSTAAGGTHSL